jgi:hypothetical protein
VDAKVEGHVGWDRRSAHGSTLALVPKSIAKAKDVVLLDDFKAMMVSEGMSAYSGEVLRKVAITSRAWSVSMFVYIDTASQVNRSHFKSQGQVG